MTHRKKNLYLTDVAKEKLNDVIKPLIDKLSNVPIIKTEKINLNQINEQDNIDEPRYSLAMNYMPIGRCGDDDSTYDYR